MEVNAVVQMDTAPPVQAQEGSGRDPCKFADQLKEAKKEEKKEKVPAAKKEEKTPVGTCGETAEEENVEIFMAAGTPCVQGGEKAGSQPDVAPLIPEGEKERPAAGPEQNSLNDSEKNAFAAEGKTQAEAFTVLQALPEDANESAAAQEFAQTAVREIGQKLAEGNVQAMVGQKGQSGTQPLQNEAKDMQEPQQTGEKEANTPQTAGAISGREETNGEAGGRQPGENTDAAGMREEPKAQEMTTPSAYAGETKAVAQQEDTVAEVKPTPSAPAGEETVFRIVSRVAAAVQEGKSELHIQLRPEHLGGLEISLSMGEDGLSAKILTDRQSVHNMLAGDLPGLQEALREKGISVAHMEVAYEAGQQAPDRDASGDGRYRDNMPRIKGVLNEAGVEDAANFYYTLSNYEVLAEHGGSVEFSA
jgi:flagellar hook-length control protein FliK